MAKRIINLTLVLVTKEINLLLKQSSLSIKKLFLNHKNFRQQLIEYVLSRIPNIYVAVAVEEIPINQDDCQLMSYSQSERQQIKNLINQGFKSLMTRENNSMSRLSLISCPAKK